MSEKSTELVRTPRIQEINTPHGTDVRKIYETKMEEMKLANKRAIRQLYGVIVLSIFFIVGEVVGGIYANSIAVMSDAAHLASDALGIGISVVALKIGERSADHRFTYGYHRAEIIGAISSILFIWLVTVWLIVEATKRLFEAPVIDGFRMLWIACICLVFNLIQMRVLHTGTLHDHAHGPGGGCDHDHGGESHDHDHGDHDHGEHGHSHSHEHNCVDVEKSLAETDDHFQQADANENDHAGKIDFAKIEVANIGHFKDISRDQTVGAVDLDKQDSHLIQGHDSAHNHSHGDAPALTTEEAHAVAEQQKAKRNLNVQAAYLHILGDVINSVGVIIASLIIWLSDGRLWYFDPICTYVFSLIVFYTTRKTFSHCIRMLMEATPSEIANDTVTKALLRVHGVLSVHCLHIWAISEGKNAISVHIVCQSGTEPLKQVDTMLRGTFGINHIACQIEREDEFECGNDLHV